MQNGPFFIKIRPDCRWRILSGSMNPHAALIAQATYPVGGNRNYRYIFQFWFRLRKSFSFQIRIKILPFLMSDEVLCPEIVISYFSFSLFLLCRSKCRVRIQKPVPVQLRQIVPVPAVPVPAVPVLQHCTNLTFFLLPFTDQPGVYRRLQGLLPGRAPEDGLGPHGRAQEALRNLVIH
jgi:hypothetical protein